MEFRGNIVNERIPVFRISILACHRCRRYAKGKFSANGVPYKRPPCEWKIFLKIFRRPKFHVQMISNVIEMTKGYKQKAVRDQKAG